MTDATDKISARSTEPSASTTSTTSRPTQRSSSTAPSKPTASTSTRGATKTHTRTSSSKPTSSASAGNPNTASRSRSTPAVSSASVTSTGSAAPKAQPATDNPARSELNWTALSTDSLWILARIEAPILCGQSPRELAAALHLRPSEINRLRNQLRKELEAQ